MNVVPKIKAIFVKLCQKLRFKFLGTVLLVLTGVILLVSTIIFIVPRTINFSYAKENCIFAPTFLPDTLEKTDSENFSIRQESTMRVASTDILSLKVCVQPKKLAPQNTQEVLKIGGFLEKSITVNHAGRPSIRKAIDSSIPVSPKKDLTIELSSPDIHLLYSLEANKKNAPCKAEQQQIKCNPTDLGLAQNKLYSYRLTRSVLMQSASPEEVYSGELKTTKAIKVTKSSIKNKSTVYSKPSKIVLDFDKTVVGLNNIVVQTTDKKPMIIPTEARAHDKSVEISFKKPLPRQKTIKLSIKQVEGADGSFLDLPYEIRFKTSGGPKVISSSLPYYKADPSSIFTLRFDSDLKSRQDLSKFITLYIGSKSRNVTIKQSGKKSLTIDPVGNLPRCASFTIKLKDGLKSRYDISGGSAWQASSRTICQTAYSIGSSVQGRAIMAYKYGSGSSVVMLVGTLHGNEKSATYTLNSFMDHLEANFGQIPGGRSIIVIPNLNPDGFAANSRKNAHGIDLNRNFPVSNWKKKVKMPDGSTCNCGGSAPLSEPESRAIANYVSAVRPRLVLSYHSVAGILAANEAGISMSAAQAYGTLSGYPVYGNDGGAIFHYDTTGAFEDYLGQNLGIGGILVELSTQAGNEFYYHRSAMMHMVKI